VKLPDYNAVFNQVCSRFYFTCRKTFEAPQYVDIQYLTLKGYMKGVLGNTWTLKHDLPTISWFAANPPHASCVPELTKTLEAEVNALTVMVPGDFYFWGGAFGRAAQLATIAEQVGRTDLIDKVVAILKESVEYWFDVDHRPAAAYETGWGGFVNGDGWNNTWVDFGNVSTLFKSISYLNLSMQNHYSKIQPMDSSFRPTTTTIISTTDICSMVQPSLVNMTLLGWTKISISSYSKFQFLTVHAQY